jgi:hypothetical protein
MRIDFFAPEITYHRLLKMPGCPACGARKPDALRAIEELNRESPK